MELKNYYPLTASQLAMFYARKFSIHKSVINIPTSIIVNEEMDMDVLEDATEQAIKRWDSFGIRLVKEGKKAKQHFAEREVESIKRLDFSNKTREDMESTFRKLGSKKLEVFDKPMARIYLVTTPEGFGGIFSVISHLIMDSWAISSFYKDLMEIYYYKMGRGDFPKDVVPYENVLVKEMGYKESVAYTRSKEYWEEEFSKDEPIYTHVNGSTVLEQYRKKKGNENSRASNGFFLRTTAGHDLYWIKKEEVDHFNEFLLKYNLPSMQVLFQMALRTYFAKVNGHEKDVGTFNVVARRGTLLEKKTGGTRVHFMVFRTIMEEEITFLEACHQLLNKQNELYRHAEFTPLEIIDMYIDKYHIKETEGYFSAAMTFQPVAMTIKEDVQIESRWYSNGAVSQPLYITIMDGDGMGGLKCYYEYMSNFITEDTIKHLHESMVLIMLKGCENPDITLGELFDIF